MSMGARQRLGRGLHSLEETPDQLRERSRRPSRKAFAQLAREGCRMTFGQIGDVLHVTADAAAKLAAAGQHLERSDAHYRAALDAARAALSSVGV
jgi:hypothetical protein